MSSRYTKGNLGTYAVRISNKGLQFFRGVLVFGAIGFATTCAVYESECHQVDHCNTTHVFPFDIFRTADLRGGDLFEEEGAEINGFGRHVAIADNILKTDIEAVAPLVGVFIAVQMKPSQIHIPDVLEVAHRSLVGSEVASVDNPAGIISIFFLFGNTVDPRNSPESQYFAFDEAG